MQNIIKVSVPGKIHLIGEHSAVYGKGAILASINLFLHAQISPSNKKQILGLIQYNDAIKNMQSAIENKIQEKFKIKKIPNYKIEVDKSGISVGSGLGTSASLSAAFTICLLKFLKINYSKDDIFEIALEGEKIFHGNPSGGDLAAILNEGLTYFKKNPDSSKTIIPLSLNGDLNFLLIDSGKPTETTSEMVSQVASLAKRKNLTKIFNSQEDLANQFIDVLKTADHKKIINIIKAAENNLELLNVVGKTAKSIIRKIENLKGAAKITGAGGIKKGSGMVLAYHEDLNNLIQFAKTQNLSYYPIQIKGNMKPQITISAPGKLMLFGEHAVVYGKPSIVTSVNQRLTITAQKMTASAVIPSQSEGSVNHEPKLILNAPDVDIKNYSKPLKDLGQGEIPKGAKFTEFATLNFYKKYKSVISIKAGIQLETSAQFKSTFGFGSSSASAVCTIKALSETFKIKLTEKEIFKLAYKTVLDVQGLGSGFDLAAAIYGKTLYFVTGGKKIEPLKIKSLPLIVGYTGIKADTATIVKEVKARFEKHPKLLKNIYDGIEIIVEEAKVALNKNDLEKVGQLMNLNQGYLETLGVSSEKLSSMIYAARNAGAYGAKLSGAGGGDCMIALAPEEKRQAVEKAIEKAGGQILNVDVNTNGVKLEK